MSQHFVRHLLRNLWEFVSLFVTGNQVSVHVAEAAPPIGSPCQLGAWNAKTRLDANLFDAFNGEKPSGSALLYFGGQFPLRPGDYSEFPQSQPSGSCVTHVEENDANTKSVRLVSRSHYHHDHAIGQIHNQIHNQPIIFVIVEGKMPTRKVYAWSWSKSKFALCS